MLDVRDDAMWSETSRPKPLWHPWCTSTSRVAPQTCCLFLHGSQRLVTAPTSGCYMQGGFPLHVVSTTCMPSKWHLPILNQCLDITQGRHSCHVSQMKVHAMLGSGRCCTKQIYPRTNAYLCYIYIYIYIDKHLCTNVCLGV